MVGGVRTSIFQILRSDKIEQIQEKPETGTFVQQVRGAERVENLPCAEKEELILLFYFICIYLD